MGWNDKNDLIEDVLTAARLPPVRAGHPRFAPLAPSFHRLVCFDSPFFIWHFSGGSGGGKFNISFLIFCEIWIQCFQALSKWYSEYGRDNEDNPVSTAANIGDAFIDMSPTQVNHKSTPTQTL